MIATVKPYSFVLSLEHSAGFMPQLGPLGVLTHYESYLLIFQMFTEHCSAEIGYNQNNIELVVVICE